MTAVTLPPGLRLVHEPLPALEITTSAVRAMVTLQGAQITAWQPTGAEPVLYLSEDSRWTPGAAIRGGIPICFPWFGGGRNHLATAAGQPDAVVALDPSHGWARVMPWHLVDASVDAAGGATVTFELRGTDAVDRPHADQFPADATVRYTMHLGAELRLEFAVIAGASLLDVETLLHTYLRVDDITATSITGLDTAPYWDKVDQQARKQSGEITITGETDRVYESSAPVRVVTPQRTIEVTTTGSSSTVVWNPWSAKAQSMSDFGDRDFEQMVCVESGNVADQAITVPPGGSHVMTVTYRLA